MLDRRIRTATIFAWLLTVGAAAATLHAAARAVPDAQSAPRNPASVARLDTVLDMIADSSTARLVGQAKWQSLVQAHRNEIEAASTHQRFAAELNELLHASGISHFKYYTDEDFGYWHLRSFFSGNSPDSYVAHIGIYPEKIEGRWFVRGVLEESVASQAGIRVGDELVSVDGARHKPIASFRGKADVPTKLRLRRRPGLFINITVVPRKESLSRAFYDAKQASIRIIKHDGFRLAYLHGWTLLGSGREYETLDDIEDQADGLLLDYRDGYGGTWHTATHFLLGRDGNGSRRNGAPHWTKPVVILTGDGTRSAKEIVVDAVQRAGRAPLVGTSTPGHVTSVGGVRRVGDDGLLMVPSMRFDLEGHPTKPDLELDWDFRYAAGADPQLHVAKELLAAMLARTGGRDRSAAP